MAVKWIELELNRGPVVEKQVDDIDKTFETLYKQAEQKRVPNVGQVVKAVKLLRTSIFERIAELEEYYRDHDVDPRSARFEAARVKLKRLIKAFPELPDETGAGSGNSNATPARSTGAASSPTVGNASTAALPKSGSAAGNKREASPEKTVVIRVVMTHEEYEDVKLRRDALRQMMLSNGGITSL